MRTVKDIDSPGSKTRSRLVEPHQVTKTYQRFEMEDR